MQNCFPEMKPKPPTLRSRAVAEEIARRIVAAVNDDNFYWERAEVPERIADVTEEIMRSGKPATALACLASRQPPVLDKRGAHSYGWEDMSEECRAIADKIGMDVVRNAVAKYDLDYGD